MRDGTQSIQGSPTVKIWRTVRPFDTSDVLDSEEDLVPFKRVRVAEVFFIDPTPEKNYPHECSYLAVPRDEDEPEMILWSWPPLDWENSPCWEEL